MSTLPIALYRAEHVRALDRAAIEERGIPGIELMERAGRAAFEAMRARWADARAVDVYCGPGNNGGDGYVVARLCREAELDVRVWQLGDPEKVRGEAAEARARLQARGVTPRAYAGEAAAPREVAVDALFGTGLAREVGGDWARAIESINATALRVLAIDIPSGLHADTGRVLGVCVRAGFTATFVGLKQGLFTGEGPDRCGDIVFDDLGVPADVYAEVAADARRLDPDAHRALLAPRSRTAHKGHFGHVLVVGGDLGLGGAARMAGEAAARVGAGLVSVATRPAHAAAMTAARPELMCRGVETDGDLGALLERATVLALGPGLGRSEWSWRLFEAALGSDRPLVVDADGLNLLAESGRRRAQPGAGWILTPHPGEAGRLLGCAAREVQADRFAAAAALAERFDAVVALKGAGTLVQEPGQVPDLCDAGNPGMASGGMGDVLTGIVAGLVAQGAGLGEAARTGVWVHARAADRAAAEGERGLLAGDLLSHLRRLVNPA